MKSKRKVANDVLLSEVCSQLNKGKRVKLHAKGDSMRPSIYGEKDILILSPPIHLHNGDVVLAHINDERYVIHRIISINSNRIILAGDNNLFQREVCELKDVFGIVDRIIRDGRERKLTTFSFRIIAFGWRMLLPFRKIKWKF